MWIIRGPWISWKERLNLYRCPLTLSIPICHPSSTVPRKGPSTPLSHIVKESFSLPCPRSNPASSLLTQPMHSFPPLIYFLYYFLYYLLIIPLFIFHLSKSSLAAIQKQKKRAIKGKEYSFFCALSVFFLFCHI